MRTAPDRADRGPAAGRHGGVRAPRRPGPPAAWPEAESRLLRRGRPGLARRRGREAYRTRAPYFPIRRSPFLRADPILRAGRRGPKPQCPPAESRSESSASVGPPRRQAEHPPRRVRLERHRGQPRRPSERGPTSPQPHRGLHADRRGARAMLSRRTGSRQCGKQDLNLHGITTTRPSTWRVCQFRHSRSKYSAVDPTSPTPTARGV
jgi:hypothetical protein